MNTSPYLIEFYGGRYDGFCQPSEAVPLSVRLEMPGPELEIGETVAARTEVYERRRTAVRFVDNLPVVSFQFHHVGARIDSPRRKSSLRWWESLRDFLRHFRRRKQSCTQVSDGWIYVPASPKHPAPHMWN